MIFGSGFLVWLAGFVQRRNHTPVFSWGLVFYILAGIFAVITLYHFFLLPKSENDQPRKATFRETTREKTSTSRRLTC